MSNGSSILLVAIMLLIIIKYSWPKIIDDFCGTQAHAAHIEYISFHDNSVEFNIPVKCKIEWIY